MHSSLGDIRFKPLVAGLCILTLMVTLVLIYAGAFTTTIGAGMVFADWPLSEGSINPDNWLNELDKLAEHSHRLLAMTVGFLMIVMVAVHYKVETRAWVRRLVVIGLVLVILQGVLGGMRVLLVDVHLAIPHAFLANVFLCLLVTIVMAQSKCWQLCALGVEQESLRGIRKAGCILMVLVFAQILVGAVMRHKGAGLALDAFPMSDREGNLIPQYWNLGVLVHFAHRVLAVILFFYTVAWAAKMLKIKHLPSRFRPYLFSLFALLFIQICLGASVIWTHRMAIPTTLHVLVGSLYLANIWAILALSYRPVWDNQRLTKSS